MALDLIPSTFLRSPLARELPSLWRDQDLPALGRDLGLTEDDAHVYVEAHVPGIDPRRDQLDVTYEDGLLSIRAASKQEGRSSRSYAYQVTVPNAVDPAAEPDARCEHGVLRVTFAKAAQAQPKRITVKA